MKPEILVGSQWYWHTNPERVYTVREIIGDQIHLSVEEMISGVRYSREVFLTQFRPVPLVEPEKPEIKARQIWRYIDYPNIRVWVTEVYPATDLNDFSIVEYSHLGPDRKEKLASFGLFRATFVPVQDATGEIQEIRED